MQRGFRAGSRQPGLGGRPDRILPYDGWFRPTRREISVPETMKHWRLLHGWTGETGRRLDDDGSEDGHGDLAVPLGVPTRGVGRTGTAQGLPGAAAAQVASPARGLDEARKILLRMIRGRISARDNPGLSPSLSVRDRRGTGQAARRRHGARQRCT